MGQPLIGIEDQVNPEQFLDGDNDICSICNSHYIKDRNDDIFWVQCEYEECGKWYHTHCIPMSTEEYNRIGANLEEWFCQDFCKKEHNKTKQSNS